MPDLMLGEYSATGKTLANGVHSAVQLTEDGDVKVAVQSSSNITNKFREAFEAYTPNGDKWVESKATGDIIQVDGSAIAASYLVISKCPLRENTESYIETVDRFIMPVEGAFGLHMSQRTLGQEFATEIVDDEVLSPTLTFDIASISQTTTTLTVTTAVPHELVPGKRISISGVNDSRFNYTSLVVASIPTPTSFTCTAGPGGTIPSVTAGPFTTGVVSLRPSLNFAKNGTSFIFENATATNASIYIRSEAGDALPSGTVLGNHSATVLTSASVAGINAPYTYAFQPTDEYRVKLQADRLQWSNVAVDSVASETNVVNRTQVVPNPSASYKLRIRARNNKSIPVPIAQIVSIAKTGTTTATVTTDVAHGLTTADLVTIYGVRDQAAASFPNLVVATAVASVIDETHFTIVIGTASTVTSYGGYVSRVNGGNLPSAFGSLTMAIQNATLTSGILTLTGSATWTGILIGDYVNIVGCRNNVDGTSMGIDGAYRVRNIATTSLELEPIGATVVPSDFTITDCGGGIIKRTDLRISFVRLFDYDRERVEFLARPTSDLASAVPVSVNNSVAVGTVTTVTGVTTVTTLTGGGVAHDAADSGNPVKIGGKAFTADPTPTASADRADLYLDTLGKVVTTPLAPRALMGQGNITLTSSTTETTLIAAAGAGIYQDISSLVISNTSATACAVEIRDNTAGTVRLTVNVPAGDTVVMPFPDSPLMQATANWVWTAKCLTSVASIFITAVGPKRKA